MPWPAERDPPLVRAFACSTAHAPFIGARMLDAAQGLRSEEDRRSLVVRIIQTGHAELCLPGVFIRYA